MLQVQYFVQFVNRFILCRVESSIVKREREREESSLARVYNHRPIESICSLIHCRHCFEERKEALIVRN